MSKLLFFISSSLFSTLLFAQYGELQLSCDSKGATVYVDGQRKTRIAKPLTIMSIKEGKHTIKVVKNINRKCQNYVEKEVTITPKESLSLSLKLAEEVEPTRERDRDANSSKSEENQRFVRTACEVVKDNQLHLMWQDDKPTKEIKLFNSSKNYCQELEFSIFNDWRLPTYEELLSIVDYTRANPALVSAFRYGFSDKYWSSSQDVAAPNYAWFVDFQYGKTGVAKKYKEYHTRCVRDN